MDDINQGEITLVDDLLSSSIVDEGGSESNVFLAPAVEELTDDITIDFSALESMSALVPKNTASAELSEVLDETPLNLDFNQAFQPSYNIITSDSDLDTGLAQRRLDMLNAGYSIAEDTDDATLVMLENRELEISIGTRYPAQLNKTKESVTASAASLSGLLTEMHKEIEDNQTRAVAQIEAIQLPVNLQHKDLMQIYYTIMNRFNELQQVNEDDIDQIADSVLESLLAVNDGTATRIADDYDASHSYIKQCASILLTNDKATDRLYTKQTKAQKKIAMYLLQDSALAIQELIAAHNTGRSSFIKCIEVSETGSFAVCPECEKRVDLRKQPLLKCTMTVFPNNRYDFICAPSIVKCSCGRCLTLAACEYDEIETLLKKKLGDKLSSCASNTTAQSSSTPVLHYVPPIELIRPAINHLISTETNATIDQDESLLAGEVHTEPAFNLDEYRKALQFFNSKIEHLGSMPTLADDITAKCFLGEAGQDIIMDTVYSKNTDGLSYSEIASHICSTLSKDYCLVKNQAIACILGAIHDNCILYDALDNSKIALLENLIDFVERKAMLKHPENDNQTVILIATAYRMLTGSSDITVDQRVITPDDHDYLQPALDYLREHKDQLEVLLRTRKAKQQEAKKSLLSLENTLRYVKLVNVSTIQLSVLHSICYDTEIANFINELADKVIISNLVLEFGAVWQSFSQLPVCKLYSKISSVDPNGRLEKVCKALSMSDTILFTCFENLKQELSGNTISIIHRLATAIKRLDYRGFCKEAYNLTMAQKTNVSKFISDVARDYDISKTDIESQLFEFTSEELAECAEELDGVTFTRFVPKRLPDETLSEYLLRYNELQLRQKLDSANSYDYLEKFERYPLHEIIYLSFADLIYEIHYSDFAKATYLNGVIDLCRLGAISDDYARNILGIADSYKVMLNKYSYTPVLYTDETRDTVSLLQYFYETELSEYMLDVLSQYDSVLLNTSERIDVCKAFNLRQVFDDIIIEMDEDERPDAASELERVKARC